MVIQLPNDLENFLRDVVHEGRYPSIDDAMAEATRLLRDQLARAAPAAPNHAEETDLGSIGAMSEDADLLDEVVEHAMRMREEQPWRLDPVE